MAAAQMLQRRIGSLFLRTQQPHGHAQLFREQIVPSASSIFRKYGFEKRDIQTQSNLVDEGLANQEGGSLKLNCDSKDVPSLSNATNSSDVKFSADANLKISPRHDLAMLFTCKVCETRSLKTCSRESYEKGVVVARCAGCNNFHLMADHLGYFGAPGSVEDFLAARGEVVKKGSSDTLILTLEDFSGKQP